MEEILSDSNNTPRPAPKNKYSRFLKWCEVNKDFLQLLLTVITLGTLISYIIVSFYQDRQIRESLKLTKTSNETYEKLTKSDLRAYIMIDEISSLNFDPSNPVALSYTVKNFGKTPSFSTINFFRIFRYKTESEIDSMYNLTAGMLKKHTREGFVMGSSGINTKEIKWWKNITGTELNKIRTGQEKIGIIIAIQYTDIFKIQHTLIDCSMYNAVIGHILEYKYYTDEDIK